MDGEALFMAGHKGGKKFAGEILPEMVEKILERAAHAAMVIGGAQQIDIGGNNALLQRCVIISLEGGVGVQHRQ